MPAADEIALRIQLDTDEDIGLLVYDYSADGREFSGGISNADGSMLKRGSSLTVVLSRDELGAASDDTRLSVQFRVITEYVAPNYENIYPDGLTRYMEPIAWDARFGEAYRLTITGGSADGYTAALLD